MSKVHLLARFARVGASAILTNNVRPAVPVLSRSMITLTNSAATTVGMSTTSRTPHTFITSGPCSVTLSRAFSSSNPDFGTESSKHSQRYDWIDDVSIQHLASPLSLVYLGDMGDSLTSDHLVISHNEGGSRAHFSSLSAS